MIIIGIAATPSVAAKSVNLFKGDAKIQKNSLSLASNVTKSLSPTIVLSTITTTTNNNKEKENIWYILTVGIPVQVIFILFQKIQPKQ